MKYEIKTLLFSTPTDQPNLTLEKNINRGIKLQRLQTSVNDRNMRNRLIANCSFHRKVYQFWEVYPGDIRRAGRIFTDRTAHACMTGKPSPTQ